MKNFKPSEVLKDYWGLIEEGKSLEDFKEIVAEEDIDDVEAILSAVQEYYENWHSKIMIKGHLFEQGIFESIDLSNCNIKTCGVLVTEYATYLFFIKDNG